MMITFIAMLVAVPIGLMSAVYLSEYANPKLRGIAKPGIEILPVFRPWFTAFSRPSWWPVFAR